MITGAVCAAIQASILGMCLSIIRLTPIANAFSLVVILWFGFSCTGLATNYAYTRKPVKLFLIDSVYHLVTWTAMMLILVQWLR